MASTPVFARSIFIYPIIVGYIDDYGNVIGVDDIDNEMLRISNMLNDSIEPSISELVEIEPVEHEGKIIILVSVEVGDDQPYYLKSKGLVPAGVFTRLGPATVPVDRRGIRKMIRHADGISFEREHCKEQELTFKDAQRAFENHGLSFDRITLKNGIIGVDGFYTNLGLLISDQNPYSLRCASFNNDAMTELINRFDCTGSIFKQAEEAEAFLGVTNALRSYFVPGKLERIDKYDYPVLAIREGIMNAIIHRDYDLHAETVMKMSRTEIMFTNYGGLQGISVDSAVQGLAEVRNPPCCANCSTAWISWRPSARGLNAYTSCTKRKNSPPPSNRRAIGSVSRCPISTPHATRTSRSGTMMGEPEGGIPGLREARR